MLYNIGSQIFIILSAAVLVIYLIFYLITFTKKEILVFLYDVKYELEKGNEDKSNGDDGANL